MYHHYFCFRFDNSIVCFTDICFFLFIFSIYTKYHCFHNAIVAFVSAVMVIGLKLISTIWDDAEVYNDLRRLGMKRKKIKGLITKQMLFVYFIPTVLGCIIGAFTTYRIMLVSGVIYIGETMQLVGCVCGLVLIIQIAIFFILRSRIMRSYT